MRDYFGALWAVIDGRRDQRSRLQLRAFNDLGKAARIEAGAADQRTVDVRLGHQFPGVVRFHTASVLDPDFVSRGFIGNFSEHLANKNVGFLGLLGCGGLASPNSPDWFV